MSQTIQVSDIFRPSWRLCKSQIWILAGLLIGYVLISVTLSVFMTPLNKSLAGTIVSNLISWVISIIFSLGYAKNMLQTIDGEEPQFSAYLQPIGKIINMMIATVLVGLAVVIGFVLLIIPGFYLTMRLQFYSLYILEEDAGPIEAIKKLAAYAREDGISRVASLDTVAFGRHRIVSFWGRPSDSSSFMQYDELLYFSRIDQACIQSRGRIKIF